MDGCLGKLHSRAPGGAGDETRACHFLRTVKKWLEYVSDVSRSSR